MPEQHARTVSGAGASPTRLCDGKRTQGADVIGYYDAITPTTAQLVSLRAGVPHHAASWHLV